MNSDKLHHKTIVIVGGTSGIGLSAAQACVAQGASVVVVGRDPSRCEAALAAGGSRWRALAGDARAPDTADCAVRMAHDEFGGLDGLYHVAGGSGRSQGDGPLDALSDEGWDFTLRWNLDSVFYSNRAAVRYWREMQRGGSVVNMTSVLAFAPSPRYFATHAYAAAKAAVIGLTRSAAAYYAPHQIRFNAIAPALVDTPMARRAVTNETICRYISAKQPLDGGRVGRPDDTDQAAVYLLSDDARFVTGQVLAVDGGWSVSEGYLAGET
ncbi:MAG: SDR family NAD(P)-dependent oxidoreductase [Pirellulaceae bacterium]